VTDSGLQVVFCKPFFPSFASARPQSGGGDFLRLNPHQ
jgi:hypothetical protein